ncbi:MAG TPA: helix-turn-helix domain-containing protein [Candidatus Enterocloster faecavium]|uniref:Helix-turn-helix domain-containing protein n=1 Tax=Candidatus Enterocloster faecavium TaxID=2838560 RepID=A0A9D2L9D4_9FIRM|nr:helix-turn-helix domain-containing protein [Candidatus Enterocloster faecavium]
MAEENMRILKLFYVMANIQGFIKANELACRLQTSERTVKSSIEQLKTFALKRGCQVISVRGKGYWIQVTDKTVFEAYRKRLDILFNNAEKGHKGKQSYAIARELMLATEADEEGYVRLEELAQELFMSASALKKEMGKVREFLSSFGLLLLSYPGKGVRLQGKEFNIRLCMLELYENHYKTRVFPFQNEAYEKTLEDLDDKDAIRKTTLNLIRDSSCEMIDIYINRIIDYFLLMRNRDPDLEFEACPNDGFGEELSRGPEYELAWKLADALEDFQGYRLNEAERNGIARLILLWSDRDWTMEHFRKRFPEICKKSEELYKEICADFLTKWSFPEKQLEIDFELGILPELVRILIQKHFGFSGCQMIGNSIQENDIKCSPLSMIFAGCVAAVVEKRCEIRLNDYNIQQLAVRFFGIIDSISYVYRPRRVLVCGRNGKASGRVIAAAINQRLGTWWQKEMTVVPLYEARKFPLERYDCLIGSYHEYAYSYNWPYIRVSQAVTVEEFQEIYRNAILPGYDLTEAAQTEKWDVLRFHRDFSGYGPDSFLQLLAFQWGKDYEAKTQLNDMLNLKLRSPYIQAAGQLLYVLVPSFFTGKRIFELYFFKKSLLWEGEQIRQAVFVAMDFEKAPRLLKFMEAALRLLPGGLEKYDEASENKNIVEFLTKIIRNNL